MWLFFWSLLISVLATQCFPNQFPCGNTCCLNQTGVVCCHGSVTQGCAAPGFSCCPGSPNGLCSTTSEKCCSHGCAPLNATCCDSSKTGYCTPGNDCCDIGGCYDSSIKSCCEGAGLYTKSKEACCDKGKQYGSANTVCPLEGTNDPSSVCCYTYPEAACYNPKTATCCRTLMINPTSAFFVADGANMTCCGNGDSDFACPTGYGCCPSMAGLSKLQLKFPQQLMGENVNLQLNAKNFAKHRRDFSQYCANPETEFCCSSYLDDIGFCHVSGTRCAVGSLCCAGTYGECNVNGQTGGCCNINATKYMCDGDQLCPQL